MTLANAADSPSTQTSANRDTNTLVPGSFPQEIGAPIAVVSVSGGKDSTATALVALERYGHDRCRFVMADTGHEHPATIDYIKNYLPRRLNITIDIVRADFTADIERKRRYVAEKWQGKGVSPEIVERALRVLHPTGNPYLDLCIWKGRFPSRKAQFCTQELKRYPLDAYMLRLMSEGHTVESWQGVRRDESEARKDALDREQAAEGWWIERPIAGWTAQQTVDYVTSRGVELNPLYSLGMRRVGCMPCINCRKDELAEIAARWPGEIDRVAEWQRIVSEASKRGFSSFFHTDSEEGDTDEDAFNAGSIRTMVEWSKTSRGGKQYDLDRFMPPAACSSTYGLCE